MSQPQQNAPAEPLFNPMSPEVIADPYPHYHRLRTIDPLHRSPLGFFVASRYADVSVILRDMAGLTFDPKGRLLSGPTRGDARHG